METGPIIVLAVVAMAFLLLFAAAISVFPNVVSDLNVGIDFDFIEFQSDGDIIFHGGSGLIYGNLAVQGNTTATVIATQDVAVQFTYFNVSTSHNVEANHTEDHIEIEHNGTYLILVSIHIESSAGGSILISFDVLINNGATALYGIHGHRQLAGGGGDIGSVSISGISSLADGDTVEFWVTNETNNNNVVLQDVSLTVIQIGGD